MSITFVQKSDLSRPRPDARKALVLAGGAISGGAFKVGGLLALQRFFTNFEVTDFDIYMGISAGAFLAAPLSAGIRADEIYKTLWGSSDQLTRFQPVDFYLPNVREFVERPLRLLRDSVTLAPRLSARMLAFVPRHRAELQRAARRFLHEPSIDTAQAVTAPMIREVFARPLGGGGSYLPSGIFDNRRIEAYIRSNLEANGLPNNFRQLKLQTGKSLYIGATNLDTAQGVIFGHDENNTVRVSEAVQASTAIPGFFRPAHVGPPGREQHYVDAAVRKTANISTAVRKGAQLVVCYNPFRPFVNYRNRAQASQRSSISIFGLTAVINQAFRTLLHSRLRLGIEKLRLDERFRGDVILIEPAETDERFFSMNPLAFWQRQHAAEHGYQSVKASLEKHYETLHKILSAYGIDVRLGGMDGGLKVIRQEGGAVEAATPASRARERFRVVSGGR